MSATCNRKKKCSNDKYVDSEKCILHCDKSEFNDTDIQAFWKKLKEKYVTHDWNDITNEIRIEGVIFPRFGGLNVHHRMFFLRHNRFLHNVEFIKCIFIDHFDLPQISSLKKITFDGCVFYGDINIGTANKVEIINSEFKHETSIGNLSWQNLHISNTKMIKDTKVAANVILEILDDCIFRGKLEIDGNGTVGFSFENSICSKQFLIQRTTRTDIENVQFKSEVKFNANNSNINIKSIHFLKDVTFENFTSLTVQNTEFNKKIDFNEESYSTSQVYIDNTKMNNVELPSIAILKISNNSEIKEGLKLNGECQTLNIENSKISKQFDIHNAKTVVMNASSVNEDSAFNGVYNDVTISACSFINLIIKSTHTLKIDNKTRIVNNLDLSGEQYENISIESSEISNSLLIGKVTKLTLDNIKSKPYVKLIHYEYEYVTIKDSKLFDLEINFIKTFYMIKSTINGTLSFSGEAIGDVVFDTVVLDNKCDFPKINALVINNNSIFNKEISFDSISSLKCNDTHFKDKVIFLSEYSDMQFEKCEFHQKMKLSKVSNELEIKDCSFKGEVDFSCGTFIAIYILSSYFGDKFLLSSSAIDKIHCEATAEETSDNNLFASLVDFTDSLIQNIKLHNCDFHAELDFTNMKQSLELSDMVSTTIEDLRISNSLVINLFQDAHLLHVNNFTLENSKLDTTSVSEEITINGIEVNEFKCDKLIALKVLNFNEMNINKLRIGSSNIEHRFRIKYSDINTMNLIASTFEDLQIIDNKSAETEKPRELRLKNTTIKNAVFDKLKYDSFMMSDAHISEAKIGYVKFVNGSRETNRFFKNYYDSISDYIQANEYYEKEMDEQLKTVKRFSSEWFVLDFGKGISNFGSSWIKPLIWIVLFTLAFYRIANFDLLSMDGFRENHITWMFNDVLKFVNPFSKISSTNYGNFYWAWILHKVLMTIFMYHLIVAIKRKTKR